MRKKIFVIVFLFFLIKPAAPVFSEDLPLDSEDLDSLRDPFMPQLPLPPAEEQNPPPQIKSPAADIPQMPSQKIPPPVVEEPLKPPVIKISGVIWSTDQPQAIINDRIVKTGDQIEAWTIEKIEQDVVELSARGQKILIPTNFGVQSGSSKEPMNSKKKSPGK